MNVAKMRSAGFSVVTVGGPVTLLSHARPFTVNGRPAMQVAGRYEFRCKGWPQNGRLAREVEFSM